MFELRHIASAVAVLLASSLGQALAAEVKVLSATVQAQDGRAFVDLRLLLSGEITDGDLEKLQGAIGAEEQRIRSTEKVCQGKLCESVSATPALVLSGPGGSFGEGLRLARFVAKQKIGTSVQPGSSCLSACGFVFLAGQIDPSGGEMPEAWVGEPSRLLPPNSRLGLHSPYLELPRETYQKETVEAAYAAAVLHLSELIALAPQLNLDTALLPIFLAKTSNEFYEINTAERALRFDIQQPDTGVEIKAVSPLMALSYCQNMLARKEKRFVSDVFAAPRAGALDRIINPVASVDKLATRITHEARNTGKKPGGGSITETVYVIPLKVVYVEDTPGPVVCVFSVVPSVDGTRASTSSCILKNVDVSGEPDQLVRMTFADSWKQVAEAARKGSALECEEVPYLPDSVLMAFAPPDTPLADVERVLSEMGAFRSLAATHTVATTAEEAVRAPPVTSAGMMTLNNVDIAGDDLSSLKGVDLNACRAACQTHERCQSFSFDKWNRWCFLKREGGMLRLEPSSISGVRPGSKLPPRSPEPLRVDRYRNRAFPGTPYRTRSGVDGLVCEQECMKEPRCVVFSFVKSTRECRLFSEALEYGRDTNVDSGVKRQAAAR